MLSNLDIDNRAEHAFALADDELRELCEVTLTYFQISRPCYVSVSIVSNDEMQAQNLQWRSVDRPTDVLSLECEHPDDPDLAPDEPCELGDIILASAFIDDQAQKFGTTFADECRLLFIHGLLHLLGYDHLTDNEAQEMQALEDVLLSQVVTDGTLTQVVLTRHHEEDA